jgi:tRNA pseudouridine55 synthase
VPADCVLVIDKPAGPTSHDVVATARRATRVSRIGHTGTLDPLATGVLALVVGRATRLASYLTAADKEYLAGIQLGASSATFDAEATAEPGGPIPEDPATVAEALAAFVGTYQQAPPAFSAKKVGGTPAYKLARRQAPVEIKPATVTAHRLELLSYDAGLAGVRVVCSSGFYVRSLAHDLGRRLGCGGFLASLRRTRAGRFGLDAAMPLDVLIALGSGALDRGIPMERVLDDWPAVTLTADGARRAAHGARLESADIAARGDGLSQARVRLLDPSGALLGLGEPGPAGTLHPVVVLV